MARYGARLGIVARRQQALQVSVSVVEHQRTVCEAVSMVVHVTALKQKRWFGSLKDKGVPRFAPCGRIALRSKGHTMNFLLNFLC